MNEWLPKFARELREIIGLDATLSLCEAFGGTALHVPVELIDDSELTLRLGPSATQRLVQHFAGETIYPPKLQRAQLQIRNQEIRQAREAGMPVEQIARIHGLTIRQIWNILGSEPAATETFQPAEQGRKAAR